MYASLQFALSNAIRKKTEREQNAERNACIQGRANRVFPSPARLTGVIPDTRATSIAGRHDRLANEHRFATYEANGLKRRIIVERYEIVAFFGSLVFAVATRNRAIAYVYTVLRRRPTNR